MDYNILATTEKITMSAASSQLWMNLRAIGDPEPKVNRSRIKGIVMAQTTLDPIEAMFKLNSVDVENGKWNADGELRGWFDGKLVIERTDAIFRTTDFPEMKFNQFLLAPYFGPGLLPHAQKLWIDELAVGTKRLGPVNRTDLEMQ